MGATHSSPPSLLIWVLCTHKVPSGQFCSPIKLSLSGDCYPSELLLPHFDQSVRRPDLEQIASLLLHLHWPDHSTQKFLKQWLRAFFLANSPCLSCPLTSAQIFIQPNFLASPKTTWVIVHCGPWSIVAQLFSHLQVLPSSPVSLVLC